MSRVSLSVCAVVIVGVVSYTLQRLVDAQNEPPMGAVLLDANIPYYWRVMMASLHAFSAGLLVYALKPQAEFFLGIADRVVAFVFIFCIIALIVVP